MKKNFYLISLYTILGIWTLALAPLIYIFALLGVFLGASAFSTYPTVPKFGIILAYIILPAIIHWAIAIGLFLLIKKLK